MPLSLSLSTSCGSRNQPTNENTGNPDLLHGGERQGLFNSPLRQILRVLSPPRFLFEVPADLVKAVRCFLRKLIRIMDSL